MSIAERAPLADIVLLIRGLRLAFEGRSGWSEVLHGIGLHVRAGEKVALVGESGSGKSVTARIVLGLVQEERAARISGSVRFAGKEISAGGDFVRDARGRRLSMIFQDPASALNPTFTIREQFREVLRRAEPRLAAADADEKARRSLAEVSIHEPERVLSSYVFQLSGGMSQRVMIAMALVNGPELLVADEPGASLDVSVQAQTLRLMDRLASRRGAAVLLISHNLGVVREFADRIYVIYRGNIVEQGATAELFRDPLHPYTRALLAAAPKISQAGLPDVPEASPEFLAPRIEHSGSFEPAAESTR